MVDYIIVGSGHEASILATKLTDSGKASVLLLKGKEYQLRRPKNWASKFWRSIKYNDPVAWITERQVHLSGRSFAIRSQPGFDLFKRTTVSRLVHEADLALWKSFGIEGCDIGTLGRGLTQNELVDRAAVVDNIDQFSSDLEEKANKSPDTLTLAFAKASMKIGGEVFLPVEHSHTSTAALFRSCGGEHKVLNCVIDPKPAITAGNLEIMDECSVSSLLLKGTKVIGVEAFISGEKKKFYASKGVILCLGALQTPKLLMLSGIGPEAELKKHGIKLICKLEGVGRNLQDRFEVAIKRHCNMEALGFPAENSFRAFKQGLEYLLSGEGLIASERSETRCLLNVDDTASQPNIQLRFLMSNMTSCDGAVDASRFIASICPTFLRPKSRGHVSLRSADPGDFPRVDPNYFSHPDDVRMSIISLRMAQELFVQDTFKGYFLPGSDILHGSTDSELFNHWVDNGVAINLPVGTCKVGSDESSVVDSGLRVRGVDGLRIVDSSILPSTIGNDAITGAVLIADRAADLILNSINQH